MLKKHRESVHELVRYPCKLCDFRTSDKQKLKIHHRFKHLGIGLECPKCKFKVPTKFRLKAHMIKIHHTVSETSDMNQPSEAIN